MYATQPLRTVLIVDDAPPIVTALTQTLRRIPLPLHVHGETDAAAAMTYLQDRPVDVVLCDLRMPRHSGIEVLEAAQRLQPRCRRVLMTGYAELPETLERLRQSSPHAFLQKPFRTSDLTVTLWDLLGDDEGALARHRAEAHRRLRLMTDPRGVTP